MTDTSELILQIALAVAIAATTPLGLRLLLGPNDRWTRLYRFAAPCGLVSLLLPMGPLSAGLAAVWLAFTIYPLVRWPAIDGRWCRRAATFYLPVAGGWLVLWRAGIRPLDYPMVIVGLTSVHFHFIGFAGQMVTDSLNQGKLSRVVAVTPALVGLGIVGSRPLECVAAACLIAALMAIGVIGLRQCAELRGLTRLTLAVSALAILVSMPLAGVYAWGRWTNRYTVTIDTMLWSHGGLNCLGFCLCGLIAANRRR